MRTEQLSGWERAGSQAFCIEAGRDKPREKATMSQVITELAISA